MNDRADVTLRYAEVSDAEAIGGINHLGWLTAYRGLVPDAVLDELDLADNVRRWAGFLTRGRHIDAAGQSSAIRHVVAERDGRVVGHVCVGPSRDHDVGEVGEVVAIYVDPDRKGRGVGSELLVTAHRLLRNDGFGRAILWTLSGNESAIWFYRKHGWELDGETKIDGEGERAIHEVRLSIDLGAPPAPLLANRDEWNEAAASYAGPGERAWQATEPSWGIFSIPDREVGVFPEVGGLDVVELGCGTAYVSAWCARAGARSVIGVDNSPKQLATAQRLQSEHDLVFPLIWGDAEHLPLAEACADVAISEYGAAIWCDPHRWIAEASRILRPGGTLTFLGNSVLSVLACNDFEHETATNELQRPQRGLHHLRWPDTDSSEYHVSHGDMIKILRANGFEVLDLVELYAPEGATTSYTFVSPEWSRAWPAEEIWIARKT